MELTKEQIIFTNLMKPFTDMGCTIEYNPIRVITPDGIELYKEETK